MKVLLPLLLILACSAQAQYYYKDIITLKQSRNEHLNFRNAGIHKIKMESFEKDDSPAEGFRCEKKITKDYLSSTLQTKLPEIGYTLLTNRFNKNLQTVRVTDSSVLSVTQISFTYDSAGLLSRSESNSRSSDDDFINEHSEEHIYHYDEKGQPTEMRLIKNKIDTVLILFSLDDSGRVALEKNTRDAGKYYYYYDTDNRLTDIVHSSEFTRDLLPDYVFEYFDTGEPARMTFFENGGKGKTTMRYEYEGGMKKAELIYINGQYTGKMVYSYVK
jgi:hypothetical protein